MNKDYNNMFKKIKDYKRKKYVEKVSRNALKAILDEDWEEIDKKSGISSINPLILNGSNFKISINDNDKIKSYKYKY